MNVFGDRRIRHVKVGKKDRFGLPRGARRKIERAWILEGDLYTGRLRGRPGQETGKGLRIRRDFVSRAHKMLHRKKLVLDGAYSLGKLFPKDDDVRLCHIGAVFDIAAGKTKVERHDPCTCFHDAEVSNEPLDGVVHEVHDLVALPDTPCHKRVSKAVCPLVELTPRDDGPFLLLRNPFNERRVIGIHPAVSCQHFTYVNMDIAHPYLPPYVDGIGRGHKSRAKKGVTPRTGAVWPPRLSRAQDMDWSRQNDLRPGERKLLIILRFSVYLYDNEVFSFFYRVLLDYFSAQRER